MIVDNGKYYLYRHIRLDTNEVFYVGLGTKKKNSGHLTSYWRARNPNHRTKIWNNIIKKTNYKVEIILESDDPKFIQEKEKEFIRLYGRRECGSGTLVNFSEGGAGAFPNPPKAEDIERRRVAVIGRKQSAETLRKKSEALKGRKFPPEFGRAISLRMRGVVYSAERMAKLRASRLGIKRTKEERAKQSLTNFPLEKRLNVKELLEQGYSKSFIKIELKVCYEAIMKVIKDYGISYISHRGKRLGKKYQPIKLDSDEKN